MGTITSAPRSLPDGSGTYTVTVHAVNECGRFADALIMRAEVTTTFSFADGTGANEHRAVVFTGPAAKGYPGPAFIWSADGESGDRVTHPARFGDTFGSAWILAFFLDP